MKRTTKKYYLEIESQDLIKADIFISEMWKSFGAIQTKLDKNKTLHRLWNKLMDAAMNAHRG